MIVKNPFQYPNPVSPEFFVGRQDNLKEISKTLIEDPGASYAIIAGRRFGKTSLLMAIADKLWKNQSTAKNQWRAFPILFDFQSCTFDSPEAFYSKILNEVRCRVDILAPDKPDDVWPSPITLDSGLRALCNNHHITHGELSQSLKQILTQLDKPGSRVRLVLLLDEVDRIIAQGLMESIGDGLRSLISTSDISSRLCLVIAGSRRLFDVVTTGSPFLNILRKCHLTLFDQEDIKDLAKRANRFSEDVVSAVWKQSGGHPLLAQYLFYNLWESSKKTINVDLVNTFSTAFQHEYLDDIEAWALATGDKGLAVYRVLAISDRWVDEDEIVGLVADPQININRELLNLGCHGLVAHQNWRRYRYAGLIFKSWFEKNGETFIKTAIAREPKIETVSKAKTTEGITLKQPENNSLKHYDKIITLFSYTAVILVVALVLALIIAKLVSSEHFIPFTIVFIIAIGALLVFVDKLTGEQFLKLITSIISKINR